MVPLGIDPVDDREPIGEFWGNINGKKLVLELPMQS
jgi:hypothetical protein